MSLLWYKPERSKLIFIYYRVIYYIESKQIYGLKIFHNILRYIRKSKEIIWQFKNSHFNKGEV